MLREDYRQHKSFVGIDMHNLDFDLEELKKYYIRVNDCVVCTSKGNVWFETPESAVLKCPSCEFVWLRDHMDEEGAKLYYDTYANSNYFVEERVDRRKAQYKLDARFVNESIELYMDREPDRILDVGSSNGNFTKLLGDHRELYGIDLNKDAVEEARKNGILASDKKLKDFRNNQFDIIVTRGVIQHVADIKNYFLELHRILRPGGLIFALATPNVKSFCAQLYKEHWSLFDPIAHLLYFDPSTLERFFSKYSFMLKKFEFPYQGTPYENIEKDYEKLVNDIKSDKIQEPNSAFWGNMINAVFIKAC